MEEKKRILFSGGGTLGPVMPLVAVLEELRARHPLWEFLWVGTTQGPEREAVEREGVRFIALKGAKLRRYRSFKNISDIGVFIYDIFRSWIILSRFQPSLLVTAGGYVSVPMHVVAYCKRIPSLVHQEDVVPGLANRIMARTAALVTATFERSLPFFKVRRKICIGNPVRARLQALSYSSARISAARESAIAYFGLYSARKTVLAIGGGTGSIRLNRLVSEALPALGKKYQLIHVTGRGRAYWAGSQETHHSITADYYRQFEFLNEEDLARAFAAADLIVTRGGMSTLSECAVLGKPAVIMPILHSHQEQNADLFVGRGAGVLFEEAGTLEEFICIICDLLDDERELVLMAHNMHKIMPPHARESMASAIEVLLCDDWWVGWDSNPGPSA